jgi:hypothetical protein
MQHVVAARNRLRPAGVIFEIGCEKRQGFARSGAAFLQHGAHVGLALRIPDGRTYLMARSQQVQDAVAADKARASGNQNRARRRPPPDVLRIWWS